MFVQIIDTDDAFDWQPINDDTGQPYDSVFQLRIITDEVDKDLRKRRTKSVLDRKKHQMVDKLDEAAYVGDLLEHAIVGWSGIKGTKGNDVPCTPDMKTRLPERWKTEILRMCAGKEGGAVAADQEKKHSETTSPSNPTV
jgi:hypothetical protein